MSRRIRSTLFASVFAAAAPAALAQPGPATPNWVEAVDLDYRDPAQSACVGTFDSWDAYTACLLGRAFDRASLITPARTRSISRSNFLALRPSSTRGARNVGNSLARRVGGDPSPHTTPDQFPYPWPSRNKLPGFDFPELPRRGGTIRIRPKVRREYVTNVDALNSRSGYVDTSVGSLGAGVAGTFLEDATCNSATSRASGTARTLTIEPGKELSLSPPTALTSVACMTVVDVTGVASPEAAIRAVRALLTAHTPTLGRAEEDHYDDFVEPTMRGGPYTVIGSVCGTGTLYRVSLAAVPMQIRLGVKPEQFLTKAGSKYNYQPLLGSTIPSAANRIRALLLSSGCESDSAFAATTLQILQGLRG